MPTIVRLCMLYKNADDSDVRLFVLSGGVTFAITSILRIIRGDFHPSTDREALQHAPCVLSSEVMPAVRSQHQLDHCIWHHQALWELQRCAGWGWRLRHGKGSNIIPLGARHPLLCLAPAEPENVQEFQDCTMLAQRQLKHETQL